MNPYIIIVVVLFILAKLSRKPGGILSKMLVRNDSQGSGDFGATRHGHTHQGVDFLAEPGQNVYSPIEGKITRINDPYGDGQYKGVTVSNGSQEWKIFYVNPTVTVGREVRQGEKVAYVQDIQARYTPDMKNHIHVELRINGEVKNPLNFI